MKAIKKVFVTVLLSMSFALTGCNTAKGVGQDVQSAGSAIEDAAD